jgi:hypothetical protein
MIDVDQGTLWCYEIDTVAGARKLRLIAGRSWVYDRYLKDFNVSGYSWKQVQELVELERRTPPTAGDAGAADNREKP